MQVVRRTASFGNRERPGVTTPVYSMLPCWGSIPGESAAFPSQPQRGSIQETGVVTPGLRAIMV
jgi:hypothetical protein